MIPLKVESQPHPGTQPDSGSAATNRSQLAAGSARTPGPVPPARPDQSTARTPQPPRSCPCPP